MEEAWRLLRRAATWSAVWRGQGDRVDEPVLRKLFLRPLRRYRDSLPRRLLAWSRWEKWVKGQPGTSDENVFAPSEMLLGKHFLEISEGGPTAASTAWSLLRWWATRLGLSMPLRGPLVDDFRLQAEGHRVRQATPLELELVSLLVPLAVANAGARSTFAGYVLLFAGSCVRFRHIQRSKVEKHMGSY